MINTKNKSVKSQIRMLLIVLCVPVWILGGAALKQMNKQLLRENVTLINAETTRIKAIISDITSTVYEFSETIVSNTNYIETLSKKKFESDLEINALESTLNHFYQDQANVSSVTLYTSNVAIPKSSHIEHLDRKTLANLSQENQRKEIVSDEQYQNNRILDNTSVTGKWCYIVRKDSLGKDVYELALVRRMWVAYPFPCHGNGIEDSTGNTFGTDSKENVIAEYNEEQKAACKAWNVELLTEIFPSQNQFEIPKYSPVWAYTMPQEVSEIQTKLDEYAQAQLIVCVIGKEKDFDANYDKMLKEFKNMGEEKAEKLVSDIIK